MATISPVSTNVIHIKCLESQLSGIPITNGYIIWCKDTGNVYFDSDNERKYVNEEKIQNIITQLYNEGALVGRLIKRQENANIHGINIAAQGNGEIFNDYSPRTYEEDNNTAISGNTATGAYAHAEGHLTDAKSPYSHTEGLGTIASNDCQHVSGRYNEDKINCIFVIGNGTGENNRSNALELDFDGNLKISGEIKDKYNRSMDSLYFYKYN